MARNPQKRPCAHAGCRAWALHGGELCSVHAGRTRLGRGSAMGSAPTDLEAEIALLVKRRDLVDRHVSALIAEGKCTAAEALRYLSVLSQASGIVARMLAQQRTTSGEVSELQRFFEEVEGRVRELAAQEEAEALPPKAEV